MKRSISFLLVSVMSVLISGMDANSNTATDRTALVLRGHVKSVEIEEYDPDVAAVIRITLETELVNKGATPIILLKTGPSFVAAALARKPEDFEQGKLLAIDSAWPARSEDPQWLSLRTNLNKPQPPTDKMRILDPNESWAMEAIVSVTVPIDLKKYTSSAKKEKLQVLKELSPIWLRVTCEIWPWNIEGLVRDREQLPFGHKLQKRWKDAGLLWLEDMRSEPIQLDLKTAVYKPASGKRSNP